MFLVLFLFLTLFIARGAGRSVTMEIPNGVAVNDVTNSSSFSSKREKSTVNVNVTVVVNQQFGFKRPGSPFGPPPGSMPTQGTPSTTTIVPSRGLKVSPGKGPDPSGPPASSPGTSFEQDGLNAHNYYRSFHDSPPMTLNNEMNSAAAAYAQKLASMGSMQHSRREEREGQGENLYMSCSSRETEGKAATAVKKWYDEVCRPGYSFGSVQSPGGAGHFTQVVWADSTELGIGKGIAQQGGMNCVYVVARYKPLGNFNTGNDDYNRNVKKGMNFDKQTYCSGQPAGSSFFDAPRKQLGQPKSKNVDDFLVPAEHATLIPDIHVIKKEKIFAKKQHPRHKILRYRKVKTHV